MRLPSWAIAGVLKFGTCNAGSGHMKRKRLPTSMSQERSACKRMLRQHVINPLWTAPPAWFAVDPKATEESGQPTEDFVYHRPVLQKEVLELLNPRAGLLILDGTCGGGGHTEALLESGADVLALDQDPDAVRHVTEHLA